MVKTTEPKSSALEKFPIAFEYDVTWQDAKKAVKIRTDTTGR